MCGITVVRLSTPKGSHYRRRLQGPSRRASGYDKSYEHHPRL